jgi:5-methylthioribose kinase
MVTSHPATERRPADERPYALLSASTVGDYALARGALAPAAAGGVTVREVSDGNLNLVFVVRAGAAGVAVKQALPYVRVHGESWPLTPRRADAEARAYELMTRITPDLVPAFHGYDPERYALVLEDLSDYTVLRTALAAGATPAGVGRRIGEFSGRLTFATSDFGLASEERKLLIARFANPELCALTEDMILAEPYLHHEHNAFVPEVRDRVLALRSDTELRAGIAELKHVYMSHAEAVVHGDLHTGSVMVGHGRVLAFDPEFAFVGPAGFDLGLFFANLLLAIVRAETLGWAPSFADYARTQLVDAWDAFEAEIRGAWPARLDSSFPDAYLERWLAKVLADAAGFAALEALRRVIGYAHLAEIDTLPHAARVTITDRVITLGRALVLGRHRLRAIADLVTPVGAVANA